MKPGLRAHGAGGNNRSRSGKLRRVRKPMSRKERRKQGRAARKKRAAFFHSKSTITEFHPSDERTPRGIKKKQHNPGRANLMPGGVEQRRAPDRGNKAAHSQSAALTREDKEIARLEKLLKMKKRKKLPSSFKEEGLDCIPITACINYQD